MRKSKTVHGTTNNQNYHPNVKYIKAPVIVGEVFEGGELFYVSVEGVKYRKALYDRFFKFEKGIVKPMIFKGDNPNKNIV